MNKLQKALKINALFSSIFGFILIILNNQLAELFGTTNNTLFWIIGLVLIYFAFTIFLEVKKQRKWAVIWIITQDFLWVLGSTVLLTFDPFNTTQTGNIIITLVALIVLFMGVNQMVGVRRIFYLKR